MDAKELKPCPFCGGEAKRSTLTDEINFGGDVITCEKCSCSSRVEFGEKTGLIEAWNDRAALPSDAAQAPVAPPVAWMIDWPDEPELGHYFGEEPNSGARSVPLYAAPVAPAAVAPSDAEFKNFHRLLCDRFGYVHDEQNGWAKLNDDLAEMIRNSSIRTGTLAKFLGVHRVTIQRVRNGKRWEIAAAQGGGQ